MPWLEIRLKSFLRSTILQIKIDHHHHHSECDINSFLMEVLIIWKPDHWFARHLSKNLTDIIKRAKRKVKARGDISEKFLMTREKPFLKMSCNWVKHLWWSFFVWKFPKALSYKLSSQKSSIIDVWLSPKPTSLTLSWRRFLSYRNA